MFLKILLNFFVGLFIGFIIELTYRSIHAKRIVFPKFVNIQMYGLTGAFLVILYFLNISESIKLVLMFIFPTLVEFITGYLYLKIKKSHLWDYSKERFNFMDIICLKFSVYWFILTAIGYYFILPLLVQF